MCPCNYFKEQYEFKIVSHFGHNQNTLQKCTIKEYIFCENIGPIKVFISSIVKVQSTCHPNSKKDYSKDLFL
jgi:hypothetical protein